MRRNANLDPTIKSELLDPNHSHFILVDNSQLNTFGGEIEFRARLESHIQKKIPVVMVVAALDSPCHKQSDGHHVGGL